MRCVALVLLMIPIMMSCVVSPAMMPHVLESTTRITVGPCKSVARPPMTPLSSAPSLPKRKSQAQMQAQPVQLCGVVPPTPVEQNEMLAAIRYMTAYNAGVPLHTNLVPSVTNAVPPLRVGPVRVRQGRGGRVRVMGHSLGDDKGAFLGLGVSYFTALWRSKYDRQRLESELSFLSAQGYNYYRMLSMVGWYAAWEGLEIAPVAFTSRSGKPVPAWPDYWPQMRALIDLAYDRYGMRTQITIFADAQLMPDKSARLEHMRKLLTEVVPGREHKVMMLEVANEAWQNGFPGDQGSADLREFTRYLAQRTPVPVTITSNHEGSPTQEASFTDLYKGSAADLATWHFSRDRGPDGGWKPVYDCWQFGELPGLPPVCSNEPIGPGSSVAAETESIRLVSAAAFAYIAKLPAYVFHSQAGVFGKARFETTEGISSYRHLMRLLPADLANWQRNDGKVAAAPFTVFAAGQPNRYWPEVENGALEGSAPKLERSADGCVRNTGSRKGERFICLPIGIRPGGLQLQARQRLHCRVYDLLTGKVVLEATKRAGERLTVPAGPGALLIEGRILGS